MPTNTFGWSNWNFAPSDKVKAVFESIEYRGTTELFDLIAYKELIGPDLAGTTYKFLCASRTITFPPVIVSLVEVEVFQPDKGKPIFIHMQDVPPVPYQYPGSWQNWSFPPSQQAMAAFKKWAPIAGATYKPCGSTFWAGPTGITYCFICEQTFIIPGIPTFAVEVFLLEDRNGNVHLAGIRRID